MSACMDDDQQPHFKHYCRVCKKGFMSGRALGGHMRAHGIGDDNASLSDDDPASDWEDKIGGASGANKRMYQLRTNPNRLKSCRTCENCGKEFLSWKSFLEHGNGKCTWDDASDSFMSSPSPDSDEEDCGRQAAGGWSKRRRSLRSKVGCVSSNYVPSDEDDLLLARCLVQLANTVVDPPMVEPEESSASASREEERRNPNAYFRAAVFDKAKGVSKGLFECKACNKVFNSHQALGGHRASHKKVKGCYAAKQDQSDHDHNMINSGGGDYHHRQDNMEEGAMFQSKPNSSFQFEQGQGPALVGAARRKSKVHECSICHRVFTSGQALGGHKRCHWITSNSSMPDTPASLPKFLLQDTLNEPIIQQRTKTATNASGKLDLNVPAWAAEMSGVRRDPRNPLSFEVSTEMHLQPWMAAQRHSPTQLQLKNKDIIVNPHNNVKNAINGGAGVEDEADSKVKLAKLSDLNDLKETMGSNGNSSQWLQVGIGGSLMSESAAAATAATTATIAAAADA